MLRNARRDMSPNRHGHHQQGWASLLLVLLASAAPAQRHRLVIHELASDWAWGYRTGVKQPLGAYRDGLSLHQFCKADLITRDGNPDYILWVDETDDTFGIHEMPTGAFVGNGRNPGGMIGLAQDGRVWLTYGSHLPDYPMKVFSSDAPMDPTSFTERVDALTLAPEGSTTPCLALFDDTLLSFWRQGPSTGQNTTVRVRAYNQFGPFDTGLFEFDIARGDFVEPIGRIGIEQLWTRYDPRFQATLLSWQWFDVGSQEFGACPFVMSADGGQTWLRADGTVINDLPVQYHEIDPILVPHDHLAAENENTNWQPGDIGLSPAGTPWLALPGGNQAFSFWPLMFWRFDGVSWTGMQLADRLHYDTKPYAVGVTDTRIVAVYAQYDDAYRIKMRVSEDDGITWSDPEVIDLLPGDPWDMQVAWVSFVQPAEVYDNTARFFYSYFRKSDGSLGRRYKNRVRYVRIEFDVCIADLTGSSDPGDPGYGVPDGSIDGTDFFFFLDAFASGRTAVADLTGSVDPDDESYGIPDGMLDADDFFYYLERFVEGCG